MFLPLPELTGKAQALAERHRAQRLPCPPVWPLPWNDYMVVCVFEGPATEAAGLIKSPTDLQHAKYEPGPKTWVRVPVAEVQALMPWLA